MIDETDVPLLNKISNYIIEAYSKGKALYGLRRYHEAIECYNKSLEMQSNVGETWHKKGLALNVIGDSSAANQCFDKARQLGYYEE